jgi:hypothetical protein
VDDYEGEQETLDLQNSTGDDSGEDVDEDADDEASVGFSGLKDVVKNASKGITEGTDAEYKRSEHNCLSFLLVCLLLLRTSQMAKCFQFLVAKKLIDGSEPFFSATPSDNAPLLITAWIMDG